MSNNNQQAVWEAIVQTPLFASIPNDLLQEIVVKTNLIHIVAGEILFKQGDASDYLYILIKGKLVSSHTTTSNKLMNVGKIVPFETIGELGVLSGDSRSLSVRAIMDSEILEIPAIDFIKWCQQHPSLYREVSQLIIERSYTTIKALTHEHAAQNINVILPLTQAVSNTDIFATFEQIANEKGSFLRCTDWSMHELQEVVNDKVAHNQMVDLFMDEWDPILIKNLHDKLTHFYVILYSAEDYYLSDKVTKILKFIEHYSDISLQLILIHPEETVQPKYTAKFLQLAEFDLHHHVRANFLPDYQRVLRFMMGKAFAVVMGGGGARGMTHLGVLQAIIEKNIPIDAIGGTSIGASVAACYALTQDLSQTVSYIHQLKVATLKSFKFINMTLPLVSLYSGNPITAVMMNLMRDIKIEDLWIPYFAVSSDLTEKCEVIHRIGELSLATRSSCSIPSILPPVVRNRHLFIDGGVLNNLPVDIMRNLIGNKHVILAASLSKRKGYDEIYMFPPVITFWDALLTRCRLKNRDYIYPAFLPTFFDALLLASSANEKRNSGAADILVSPVLSGFGNLLSITPKNEGLIMRRGYDETVLEIDNFITYHPGFNKF
jgi:NTE family protein